MEAALSLIVIRAHDLEASLAFYGALGLVLKEEQHGAGPIHHSCDFGGLVLELYPLKPGSGRPDSWREPRVDATMLGFTVASLEEALAGLQALGVEPKSAPVESEWGRWATVADPDGRAVRITQAVR